MTGVDAALVPCTRCKQRRVKCDKRLPGCIRCEKSSQPCPGYNRVRKFLDEGDKLHTKFRSSEATATATKGSRAEGPRTTSRYRHNVNSSLAAPAGKSPVGSPDTPHQPSPPLFQHRPLPDGAGVLHEMDAGTVNDSSPFETQANSSSLGGTTAADQGSMDFDFDTTFFDIDPQVYYADPRNRCLLIPPANELWDDDFWSLPNLSVSTIATPQSADSSTQWQNQVPVTTKDVEEEAEDETSCMIRYFAENTSQCLDVFDTDRFFGHIVPVKALQSSLLRNSLAAVTAKQLGALRTNADPMYFATEYPPSTGLLCSLRDLHLSKTGSEWFYQSAGFYDKAIGLMMASLSAARQVHPSASSAVPDGPSSLSMSTTPDLQAQMSSTSTRVDDDLLTAVSVFLLYESFDNRQDALAQHMEGASYLLGANIDKVLQLCRQADAIGSPIPAILSPAKAWQSTFWNFAWVDCIVSYTQQTKPHLDLADANMWEAAGLRLCRRGGQWYPEALRDAKESPSRPMTETMASRCIIWILLHVVDAATATANTEDENALGGNNVQMVDSPVPVDPSKVEDVTAWPSLAEHLETWRGALLPTFAPCISFQTQGLRGSRDVVPGTFFSNPMCATTSLLYHFARILLLLHMPLPSSRAGNAARSAAKRLNAQKTAASKIDDHARQICAIAVGQSSLAVRMHLPCPLYLCGLCIQDKEQRQLLVHLLSSVQRDTGYSTEWTIGQLRREWGPDGEVEEMRYDDLL